MKPLIIFLLCLLPIKADIIPVLLWGAVAEEKPALQTINSQEFETIINGLLQHYMIITFADEQLDYRTLTTFRKKNRYFYGYLKSRRNTTFYMNVENPLNELSSHKIKSTKFSDILNDSLKCDVGSRHVIDIATETINDSLKSRNEKIKLLVKILNNCPVVYIYTARNSISTQHKLHRIKREEIHVTANDIHYIIGPQVLMAWQKLILHENKKTLNVTIVNVHIKVEKFNSLINMTLQDDRELHLHFTLTHGYYVLKHIDINGKKFLTSEFEIPADLSYACHKLYGFQQSTSNYLEWHKFQLQFFKKPVNSHKIHFSAAWSCDGFVTPTLLAALICAAIMIAIGFCGVTWIMDIQNMDRFDDPSGKGLTIISPNID